MINLKKLCYLTSKKKRFVYSIGIAICSICATLSLKMDNYLLAVILFIAAFMYILAVTNESS